MDYYSDVTLKKIGDLLESSYMSLAAYLNVSTKEVNKLVPKWDPSYYQLSIIKYFWDNSTLDIEGKWFALKDALREMREMYAVSYIDKNMEAGEDVIHVNVAQLIVNTDNTLGIYLDISLTKLNIIKQQCKPQYVKDKAYRVLMHWKNSRASPPTQLKKALTTMCRMDVIVALESME